MAMLIEPEYPKDEKGDNRRKDKRYDLIRSRFEDQKIDLLEDIFDRISRATVADDIEKKPERFNYLIDHVEGFFVRDIVEIGRLCDLTIPEMFKLVEAQYAKQNNRKS
jgi:hypothetical protein